MKDTNRKPAPPGIPPDGGRTPYRPQDNPNTTYFDNDPTRIVIRIPATSRHGINPSGLLQAVQATRTLQPGQRVTLFYGPYDDAIITQVRTAADPINHPSLYDYVTTTDRPLTAAEIIDHIDDTLDLADKLPF